MEFRFVPILPFAHCLSVSQTAIFAAGSGPCHWSVLTSLNSDGGQWRWQQHDRAVIDRVDFRARVLGAERVTVAILLFAEIGIGAVALNARGQGVETDIHTDVARCTVCILRRGRASLDDRIGERRRRNVQRSTVETRCQLLA